MLKGRTRVGENVVIKAGAILEDSEVEESVVIEPYSYVSGSVVKKGAKVGPYARVREGSIVGEGAEVGNFVEVKKSEIGKDVKAKHLAYIGDATVGDFANIGAGVVTANYDGRKKYRTEIGKGAFIGSNSLLVAPLKLGNFSYVAGGSVITKDVPEGALAIERSRMRILKDRGRKLLGNQEDL